MEAKAITAMVCSRGESLTHHTNEMNLKTNIKLSIVTLITIGAGININPPPVSASDSMNHEKTSSGRICWEDSWEFKQNLRNFKEWAPGWRNPKTGCKYIPLENQNYGILEPGGCVVSTTGGRWCSENAVMQQYRPAALANAEEKGLKPGTRAYENYIELSMLQRLQSFYEDLEWRCPPKNCTILEQ